jgi:replication-associated recombination protein RarA
VLPSGLLEQNGNVTVKVELLRPIKNPRSELDRLVGCRSIKQRMDELLALTRYNAMLRNTFPDNKQHEVSLHSVFLGRPGTGKTTVCKIFGSLLHEAGVLSKGHVVVCNRGTFLGTLWGDEERSVRQVVEMAQGGGLMIDEAYLLNGKNQNDPGRVVLPMLMDILANEAQRDIAVVLCGYKEPMLRLLELNPGLHSRFPNRFEFCDFTVDELLQITRQRIGEYKYHFTRQAWEKYKEVLQAAYDVRDPDSWGNARYVANQLERIYVQHATRIVKHRIVGKRQLLALTPADILPIETPRQRPRIGF